MKKLLALAMFGLLLTPVSYAKTYKLIFANYFGPSHPNTKTMQFFKEKIEKDSNGAFNVILKPNNEIGGEEKIMELVKRGTIQAAMVGGLVKDDEPMFVAWEQPFIIDGWDHAKKVFFSEDIKQFEGDYTKNTGVLIKGYIVNGFRQISSNFPINNMQDLKGMKIRTPLNEVFIQIFKAINTNPTPMPMTELYTALETKVVDGQDNPYSTVKAMGWWEVQPYLLESRHVFSPTFILVNGKFFNNLPENLQKVFDDSMAEAVAYNWEISENDELESVNFMKSKNIQVIVPDETFKQDLRNASKVTYEYFDKNIPKAKEFRDFTESLKQ